MRPLPIRAIRDAPEFVLGVSTVRGIQTPVVDLGHFLFGPSGSRPPGAFLSLRSDSRSTVLALDRVVGVRALPAAMFQALPALLSSAASQGISALGTLDEELLVILESGVTLPEELWSTFDRTGDS